MTDLDLGILLFAQLVVILVACRVVGWIGRKFLGQTQVVSEMIAGVFLGPSLLGLFWPNISQTLFPMTWLPPGATESVRHPSMQIIYAMSQVGLVLYMFIVGLEFNTDLLKHRGKGAVFVSLAGIIAPFALGAALSGYLLDRGDCFSKSVSPTQAALYTGAAMCITAFPMLARILFEKRIARTSMGTLALGAGATDDAVAWSLLAIVLAFNKQDPMIAAWAIGGGVAFAITMATVGRKAMGYFNTWLDRENGKMTPPMFAAMMCILMFGAFFTDAIGIYAVFGAFIVGACVPRGRFVELLQEKIELLTVSLILPLFFVFSGLNTKIGLLNTPELWMVTGVVILFAMIGKGLACTLAAKASGEPWRESFAIGTLMNARGLMELIILNIGYQAGLISQTMFTMFVLMAIITTLIASPLFEWIYGRKVQYEIDKSAAVAAG